MPILDVELIRPTGEEPGGDLAERIADAAGEVLGAPAGTTWVLLRRVPEERYAENGGPLPAEVRPVIVRLLLSALPDQEALATQAHALASAIAAACGRPEENVHLVYEPPGAGRVAFGGRLVPAET